MRPAPWGSDNRTCANRGSGGSRAGQGGPQLFSMDLLLDAVVIGVLLGCFYAAVSLGLSVSFGLLDVPHIAHPAFLVLASYAVFFLNEHYGIDPLLAGLLITPFLFLFGLAVYRLYYETFEKRGSDAGVRGIAFFFGIAFIIEVLIILQFGVDQRSVTATYIGRTFCVVVMAGLGSMTGTLVAAIILGVAESIVLTLFGASWAPAISFALLLAVLAVRPQGLFGG